MRRQIEILEDGGSIEQETRLYDPERDETRSMRSKEEAHDYRYFPDPDLLPVVTTPEWIERVRAQMPELPQDKRERFVREYALSAYDARTLTASRETADFFEQTVAGAGKANAKLCANWVSGEVAALLNRDDAEIADAPITSAQLAAIVLRVSDNTISNKIGREILGSIWAKETKQIGTLEGIGAATEEIDAIIEARGLKQISDSGALEKLVDEVLAANPKSVEEFHAGKEKAFNALVGQAMKATKGKANPQQVSDILRGKLSR
jgi:aspartyl-tRNA(Asn)/glutamyl-tRNA(Gln) amidotransferase subunit B